jgi:hypothetical protein
MAGLNRHNIAYVAESIKAALLEAWC